MKQFHKASLLKYNNKCKEHILAYRQIKGYNFNTDIQTIKQLLETTEFTDGVIFYEEDLKHFVIEGKFMVGIDIVDDDLDDWSYLFDAYNVYVKHNHSDYYSKDPNTTKTWRTIMKNFYSDSTYSKDLRIEIEEERKQALAKVNSEFDLEIENL